MSVPFLFVETETDGLGGFEHAKRSRGRDGSSHEATSTAEFDELAEEVAKLRVQNAELKSLKWVRTKRIGQACLSFFFRLESTNEKTKSYISGEL